MIMLESLLICLSLVICAAVLYFAMDRFWDLIFPEPSVKPESRSTEHRKTRIAMDNAMYAQIFARSPDLDGCEFLTGGSSDIMNEMKRRNIDIALLSREAEDIEDGEFRSLSVTCSVSPVILSGTSQKITPLAGQNRVFCLVYRTIFSPLVRSLFDSGVLNRL